MALGILVAAQTAAPMEGHMSDCTAPQLVLASASPRRVELLRQLGWEFVQQSADIDESMLTGEAPAALVERLAREKAAAVAQDWPADTGVLGSDTIVEIDGKVLGKPQHQQQAVAMLELLSGRIHRVMTAIALCYRGHCYAKVVTTEVQFTTLTPTMIADYWHSGEPQDKAGSYGIQGLGGNFVERIVGSYSAVVGLPLVETQQLLSSTLKS